MSSILADVQKKIKPITGPALPSEVYEKLGEVMCNSADVVFEAYSSTMSEKELIEKVADQISGWLTSVNTSCTANGVKYTIKWDKYLSHVQVSDGTSTSDLIIADNATKQVLASYCVAVYNWGHDVINNQWKEIQKGCAADAVSLVVALYVNDEVLLKKVLGNSFQATAYEVKRNLENILNSDNGTGKKFVTLANKYESLRSTYSTLEREVGDKKDISDTVELFTKNCNNLESELGLPESNLVDPLPYGAYGSNGTIVLQSNFGDTFDLRQYARLDTIIDVSVHMSDDHALTSEIR